MTIAPPAVRIGVGEVRISEQARKNVLDVLENNRLSYGRYTRELEHRFAALHERRFSCFVNSGTDALRIGLAAMKEHFGWKDGSRVIVPALTFVATYNIIVQNRLRPYFVDIEPQYYGLDSQQMEDLIGHHLLRKNDPIVAALPVHLFGQTGSPAWAPVAREAGLGILTDSCETMFVPGCAAGDVSAFSTYACHLINTGVGGLATTNDPTLAMLIRSLANHGRDGIYTGIDEVLGNIEVIDARFRFERMGYSSRATEMEAAIGCAELDVWNENLARRRVNAALLSDGLKVLPLVLPKIRPGSEHAWMMFPVRTHDELTRDRLVQHVESLGIETRYLLPLTSQPYIRAREGADVEDRFPVAKLVNRTGFYVGCHQYLKLEDLQRIIDAFRTFNW